MPSLVDLVESFAVVSKYDPSNKAPHGPSVFDDPLGPAARSGAYARGPFAMPAGGSGGSGGGPRIPRAWLQRGLLVGAGVAAGKAAEKYGKRRAAAAAARAAAARRKDRLIMAGGVTGALGVGAGAREYRRRRDPRD